MSGPTDHRLVRGAMARALAEVEEPDGPVARYLGVTGGGPSVPVGIGLIPGAVAPALATEAGSLAPQALAYLGATLELLFHSATILDDLQDGSQRRHSRPAAWVSHGPEQAINMGVWLLAAAQVSAVRASLPPELATRVHLRLALSVGEMARGQWQDLALTRRELAGCLAIGRQKTGGLLALGLQFGGLAAGAEPASLAALDQAGHLLGEAVQLHDDLSDLLGPEPSGLPRWNALLAATYPHLPPEAREALDAWLAGHPPDPGAEPIPDLLRRHGAPQMGLFLADVAVRKAWQAARKAGLPRRTCRTVARAAGLPLPLD